MSARIERVEVFPFAYPTRGRFKFFEDAQGRSCGRPSVLVKITADDGVAGWGQSVPAPRWSYETLETVVTTIERHLAPALIGRDPSDRDAAHTIMGRVIAPSFSTGQPIAKAGIDLALHDWAGRKAGRNAGGLWGEPARKRIPLSWTVNPRTLDEIEEFVRDGWDQGYRHFNVKVAPDLNFDRELCRRVKALAPDGFLWADANGGYTEETALRAAPILADLGVAVLEQPLPPNRLSGYRRLKELRALPILMDEGLVSTIELQEFVELDLLDGIALKPARCGGLTEARRQLEFARDAGLMILGSGLTDPDLSLAASLILYGSYATEFPAALNGPQFLEGSVLREAFEVSEGCLEVPTGVGLGVEVDDSRIKQNG